MTSSKQKIVAITGAGISAESGIKTFREANGLWENYSIEEVASPSAWARNPKMVLDFYNARRRQLHDVSPNQAHHILYELEEDFDVSIITQNVDDLHERAGSNHIIHLHGELRKVRSTANPDLVYPWVGDLREGDLGDDGAQLRPHIVWFGEAVPMIDYAVSIVKKADIIVVVGTSLQVYPAAGLVDYVQPSSSIYLVDPQYPTYHFNRDIHYIPKGGSEGMSELKKLLLGSSN